MVGLLPCSRACGQGLRLQPRDASAAGGRGLPRLTLGVVLLPGRAAHAARRHAAGRAAPSPTPDRSTIVVPAPPRTRRRSALSHALRPAGLPTAVPVMPRFKFTGCWLPSHLADAAERCSFLGRLPVPLRALPRLCLGSAAARGVESSACWILPCARPSSSKPPRTPHRVVRAKREGCGDAEPRRSLVLRNSRARP